MTPIKAEAHRTAKRQDKIARAGFKAIRRELLRAARYASSKYALNGRIILPDDFRRRLSNVLSQVHSMAMKDATSQTQRLLKSAGSQLETKFDWPEMSKRFAFEFAFAFMGGKVSSIESSLIGSLTGVIKAGMLEGEGQDKIAKRINSLAPRLTKTQAARIARTEVHGASGYASMKVAETVGDDDILEQEWVTTEDDRTREAHRRADEQRRPLGQPFLVDGEALRYPGDPNGSAANVINCRCVSATVLKD